MSRRLGLFGGTFDPPHLGHLALAEWARDRLGLERVVFMPAGEPPHKLGRVRSSAKDRVAMTRLAVKGRPEFEVSRLEANRRGPSFTVDTLRALRARDPRARWYLLIGADSLAELDTWREPEAIVRLATPVVAARPGSRSRTPRRVFGRAVVRLDNPGIDVSSSAIRERARRGHSIRFLVPDGVERYIARRRLYRDTPARPRRARSGVRPRGRRAHA